jgi:uncharacterized Rmd1/YagE family protein
LVRPDSDQQVDPAGNIVLREKTTERLQLVADILAKSLVLSHYETRIAEIFDGSSRWRRHCGRKADPGSCCATSAMLC